MRYENTGHQWAASDLAFVKCASIRIWLRVNEPAPWMQGIELATYMMIGIGAPCLNSAPCHGQDDIGIADGKTAFQRQKERTSYG